MRVAQAQEPDALLVLQINAEAEVTLGTNVLQPDDYRGPAAFPPFPANMEPMNPVLFRLCCRSQQK